MKLDMGTLKSGDTRYMCLPVAENLPPESEVKERHPDWELIQCPVCGEDCWKSKAGRELEESGTHIGVCTACAVRAVMKPAIGGV